MEKRFPPFFRAFICTKKQVICICIGHQIILTHVFICICIAEKDFEAQVEPVFRGSAFEEAFPVLAPPHGSRAPESTKPSPALLLQSSGGFATSSGTGTSGAPPFTPPKAATTPSKRTVIGGYKLIPTPPGFEVRPLGYLEVLCRVNNLKRTSL